MKRNILHTLWLAAAVLLAASCSQEEISVPGADGARALSITVTDGGYAPSQGGRENIAGKDGRPASAPQTRAAEDLTANATAFTAGDQVGLYVVNGGKITEANVCLTAAKADGADGEEASALVWNADEELWHTPGDSYYLYYPYRKDMSADKVTAPAEGATADDAAFFAPLISDWQVNADQSDYATGYTASDLMTATATTGATEGGRLQLTFAMTHRMALAVIELPGTVYKFTNNTGTQIPDYTVPSTATFTGEARPCRMKNGTYRYLCNPATTTGTTPSAPEIAGSYADGKREFAFTPSAKPGHFNTYKVDGGSEESLGTKEYTLQVGDYLLADGNLLPKDTELSEEQKANIAAIVFWTPAETNPAGRKTPASLTDDKIMAAAFPGCTHGLAVSLKDVSTNSMQWQYSYETVADFQSGDNFKPANKNDFKSVASGIEVTDPINYVLGYQNTQVLLAYNAYCTNNRKESCIVKPVAALAGFKSTYPAPANSTGWFLPSAKELHILCYKDVDNVYDWNAYGTDTKYIVNASLDAVSGDALGCNYYWSSSERAGLIYRAFNVNFSDSRMYRYNKDLTFMVRAVCAF